MSIEDKIKQRMDEAVTKSYYKVWYQRLWNKVWGKVLLVLLVLLIMYFVYFLVSTIINMYHVNKGDIYNEELNKWITQEEFVDNQKFVADLVTDDDPWLGAEEPLIYVVAYESFGCPYCQENQADLKKLLANFGNIVRFVTKDFPTEELHPNVFKAHLAAACAHEQGRYWEYHDILYQHQGNFSNAELKDYAQEIGLKINDFNDCLDNETHQQEIRQDYASGVQLGVQGTPSYIINSNLIPGVISYENWEGIIGFILQEGY